MPRRYEAMRDSFLASGMKLKAAKTKAAKIYNATRKKGQPSLQSYIKREKRK